MKQKQGYRLTIHYLCSDHLHMFYQVTLHHQVTLNGTNGSSFLCLRRFIFLSWKCHYFVYICAHLGINLHKIKLFVLSGQEKIF